MGGLFGCLPLILGTVGLLTAKDAVDPQRTRWMSWAGIGLTALNIVLNVILIRGLGPIPRLGTAGAATGTLDALLAPR